MTSEIPMLVIVAIVVTIFEILLTIFLIKKKVFKPSIALYTSVPAVVIIWFVALTNT